MRRQLGGERWGRGERGSRAERAHRKIIVSCGVGSTPPPETGAQTQRRSREENSEKRLVVKMARTAAGQSGAGRARMRRHAYKES